MSLTDIIYGTALRGYAGAVAVASRFNRKAGLMREGHRHVWQTLGERIQPGQRYVWVHAASYGEFEQGRELIERIRREHPEYRVLLTFFSPSGYEPVKNRDVADVVCYLPFDTKRNAKRLLSIVRPEKVFFVKYEFWRNYLRQARKSGAEVYLISGVFRADQIFFKPHGTMFRKILNSFTHLYLQDKGSCDLLKLIGVENVTVAGDTRFDRVTTIREKAMRVPVLDAFLKNKKESERGGKMVFMAGSSWPEDEEIYGEWLRARKDVTGVIAPHEFNGRRLAKLLEFFGDEAVLKSEAEKDLSLLDKARILIIDCFGVLSSSYAYCDVAYVGGGFGAGLHNINEAAVFGVPVIYGPNNNKFIEAQELKVLGGGLPVDSKSAFEHTADRLLYDVAEREKRGRWAAEYISEKTGATDKIYRDTFPSL